MGVIIILVIIVLGLWCYNQTINNDENEIREWVSKRGETTTNVDLRTFHTGPYYITKNYRIFKVDTDKNVYWFRFGWFSPDIYKETNGDYTEVK